METVVEMNGKMHSKNEVKSITDLDSILFKEVREKMYLLKKQVFLSPTKDNVMELKKYRTMLKDELDL